MANATPVYDVVTADMLDAYTLQTRPELSVADFPSTWGWQNSGKEQSVRYDKLAGCAYARPGFVVHDNRLKDMDGDQVNIPYRMVNYSNPTVSYPYTMPDDPNWAGPYWTWRAVDWATEASTGNVWNPDIEMFVYGRPHPFRDNFTSAYRTRIPMLTTSPPGHAIQVRVKGAIRTTPSSPAAGTTRDLGDTFFRLYNDPALDDEPYAQGLTFFYHYETFASTYSTTQYDGSMAANDLPPPNVTVGEGFAGSTEAKIDFRFEIGTGSGAQEFCIRIRPAVSVQLFWRNKADAGDSGDMTDTVATETPVWVLIRQMKGSGDTYIDSVAPTLGQGEYVDGAWGTTPMRSLSILYINNILQVFVGGSHVPMVVDLSGVAPAMGTDGNPDTTGSGASTAAVPLIPKPTGLPVITRTCVDVRWFVLFGMSAHRTKFLSRATANSSWINTGVPLDLADVVFEYAGVDSQYFEDEDGFSMPTGFGGQGVHWLSGDEDTEGDPDQFHIGWLECVSGVNDAVGSTMRYALTIHNDGPGASAGMVDVYGDGNTNDEGEWQNNGPLGDTADAWNSKYSNFTAAVTRILIHQPGEEGATKSFNTNLTHYVDIFGAPTSSRGPKSISISSSFDLNSLTIRSQAQFTLDNHDGLLGGTSKNVACYINLGYPGGVVDHTDWLRQPSVISGYDMWRAFTGFAYRYRYSRPLPNQRLLHVTLTDRIQQLMDAQVFAPVNMDGWNHYYAVAWCAQMAGVTDDYFDTSWGNKIPWGDPYAYINEDADDAYFLPLGVGLHPWTPKNRAMSVWELLQHIRRATGYVLFFDPLGKLRYQPWGLPSGEPAGGHFYEAPKNTLYSAANPLWEMWNCEVTSDTTPVRNQIVVVGVDAFGPSWSPIVVKREDADSIDDATAFNHVGYRKPAVWMNSQFANVPYAIRAADRMYQYLTVPDFSVSFETWLRPDLYPGDVVYVHETTSGVLSNAFEGGVMPFLITQVNHQLALSGAVSSRTHVVGRYMFGRT